MDTVVHGNLERARQGGVPGTYTKVAGYLNVKLPSGYQGQEVCTFLFFYTLGTGIRTLFH